MSDVLTDMMKFKLHKRMLMAGLLSATAYLYLTVNSQYYKDLTLFELWAVSGVNAVLCLFVWRYYHQQGSQGENIPVHFLLLFAVLFRLIGVCGFPILEDDFYRYLWDGRMTIETGSAYGVAPSALFNDTSISESFETILGLINYPDIATVYGPVCQWVFALGYLIAPGQVWPLQFIFVLADLGIILLLLRLAKPLFVLLYAWSPLLIKEFAFTAHPDVLGVFFMVAAFHAYTRQSFYCLAILLALAVGVKVFAFLLIPLLLRFHWRAWLVFFATAVCIALPFGIKAAWLPEGLNAMASDWLFNAPLYTVLALWLPISVIKMVLLSVFVMTAAGYFFYVIYNQLTLPIRADLLYGIFFLCIPVFNPWYIVWLLPFATIYPSRWAWTASFCLLLAYASGINLPNTSLQLYQQPIWILVLQFSVIFSALCWDILSTINKQRCLQT